jgi:hypothetical protein
VGDGELGQQPAMGELVVEHDGVAEVVAAGTARPQVTEAKRLSSVPVLSKIATFVAFTIWM